MRISTPSKIPATHIPICIFDNINLGLVSSKNIHNKKTMRSNIFDSDNEIVFVLIAYPEKGKEAQKR
jgi:hypothetical protein